VTAAATAQLMRRSEGDGGGAPPSITNMLLLSVMLSKTLLPSSGSDDFLGLFRQLRANDTDFLSDGSGKALKKNFR
jgi:hypothetical protein